MMYNTCARRRIASYLPWQSSPLACGSHPCGRQPPTQHRRRQRVPGASYHWPASRWWQLPRQRRAWQLHGRQGVSIRCGSGYPCRLKIWIIRFVLGCCFRVHVTCPSRRTAVNHGHRTVITPAFETSTSSRANQVSASMLAPTSTRADNVGTICVHLISACVVDDFLQETPVQENEHSVKEKTRITRTKTTRLLTTLDPPSCHTLPALPALGSPNSTGTSTPPSSLTKCRRCGCRGSCSRT